MRDGIHSWRTYVVLGHVLCRRGNLDAALELSVIDSREKASVCAAAAVCWLRGITRRCGPVAERIIPTSTRIKGGTRVDEKGHVVRLALRV